MAKVNPKGQKKEVKLEGELTIGEVPSRTRLTFDLVTSMRALHEDHGQKEKDESIKTYYLSRLIFKINNTPFITIIFMNKDPKKSPRLGGAYTKGLN